MANWLNNGIGENNTTRTCSQCHITQTVVVYDNKVMYQYCPYCGSKMIDTNIDNDMTSKELHVKRIVPARQEVQVLENKYFDLYRKEKAEENGLKRANCDNCAKSCVLCISDHNECLGGNCTCCHGFCYGWMPENSVSAYLREHHHYNDGMIFRLQEMFGDDFLECDDLELVQKAIALMDEIKDKSVEMRAEARKKKKEREEV